MQQLREKTAKDSEQSEVMTSLPQPNSTASTGQSQPTADDGGAGKLSDSIDFTSLKSISDLGIDVSFLEHFEESEKKQKELDNAAGQVTELNKLQSDRLSLAPTNEKAKIITEEEEKVAGKLRTQLASLTADVTPSDVTDVSKVEAALGVGLVPINEKPDGQVVDELLTAEEGALPVENVTQADALCHAIPLDESPSTSTA